MRYRTVQSETTFVFPRNFLVHPGFIVLQKYALGRRGLAILLTFLYMSLPVEFLPWLKL